jgi:hypothetical protein
MKYILTFLLISFKINAQMIDFEEIKIIDLDKFGGYKKITFQASGFFRIEKTKQRTWLVTPEGNAFLSNGINHVEPKWMKKFYNVDYWAKKYEVVDFSDNTFKKAFNQKAKTDIQNLGFNTLGCHSHPDFENKQFIPYVKTIRFVNIQHYTPHDKNDFPDVFSKAFEIYTDSLAKINTEPLKNDPFLLGYFMVDCPILTEKDAAAHGNNIYGSTRPASPTWSNVIRNLGSESAGKIEYVLHIKERYKSDIQAFNQVYQTNFKDFEELKKQANWRWNSDLQNEKEQADNHSFLLKILEKRYAIERASIKKYDPNHLILGDKLNGNTDTPEDIIKVSAKYSDIVFIQHYAFWNELEGFLNKISAVTDKPILQGDASAHVPYENMPNPYGPHCENQQERLQKIKEMYLNAFARKDFIGWYWCGWMDSWEGGGQVGKQHGGLQDPFGNFHPVGKFLSEFSKKMYSVAQKNNEK